MARGYNQLRIIGFGAHPDDCDLKAGGIAAKYAALGHSVKFVSVTNGDAGHNEQGGGALARRRRREAIEAGRRIGIEYEVLENHDGELVPSLEVRRAIIRKIREWQADVVLSHRPSDYHPDHRYTAVLVQDASFTVTVPNILTDTPALRTNPVFLYFSDTFTRPQPFRPDIVVGIDDVFEKKITMLDAHVSQMYEWLPWLAGRLADIPQDPGARLEWLASKYAGKIAPEWRLTLEKWYGPQSGGIQHAEAFEISEYGSRPNETEIRDMFPFLPASE